MERARRDRFAASTVPSTWQGPAIVGAAAVIVVAVTPLVVQYLVGWVSAGEEAWPSGRVFEAYRALLHGRFGAGLDPVVAEGLPADCVMWFLTAMAEGVVVIAAVVFGRRVLHLSGAASRHGLATPTQAAEALGVSRLRASAAVVRPDLCGRGQRSRTAERTNP